MRTCTLPRRDICTALVWLLASFGVATSSHAAPATENVPLPGGVKALAAVLGVDTAPSPARAMTDFARLLHGLAEGADNQADGRIARVREHAAVVATFQSALAAVQPGARGLSLTMAANKTERKALQQFLGFIGVKLRERKKKFSVERGRDRDAAARVAMLASVGVDLESLTERLNAGETVRIEIPADEIPIPFTADFWSQHILTGPVAPRDLATTILSDRRAALLAHGALALDDDTLAYLSAHPDVIERLEGGRAAAFAAFGHALSVRNGRVETPGGPDSAALWEEVVGESVTRPDRFLLDLLGRDGGHVAYLYAVVSQLDAERRAFALGAWIKDTRQRRERFRALVDAATSSVAEWEIERRPFARPSVDVGTVLASVEVTPGGAPAEPSAQKFWSKVFDSSDLPDEPARELRDIDEDGVADAAWFVQRITSVETIQRPIRLEQMRFGQRTFRTAAGNTLGDALLSVRALTLFPVLMHTLERSGVRSPSVFAAAARRALVVSRREGMRAHATIAGFQAAVALVERLVRVGSIDATKAENAITALSTLDIEREGQLGAGLATWLQSSIGSALNAAGSVTEATLIDAAAGVGVSRPATIRWEARAYRVDVAAADARHLRRIRDTQSGPSLDVGLALDRALRILLAPGLTLTTLRSSVDVLRTLAPQLTPLTLTDAERPPGLDTFPDLQQRLTRLTRDLSKITKPNDLKKATEEADQLREILDAAMAHGLLNLTYACAMVDVEDADAGSGVIAFRHDFGFGEHGDDIRAAMWSEPTADLSPGRPWRAKGAILGLEVPFGLSTLRRLASDDAPVSVLNGNDIMAIIRGVALLNARKMSDDTQRLIAETVARGRIRVQALERDQTTVDLVVRDGGLDGWRARELRWTLAHAPATTPALFSLKELLRLGNIGRDVDLSPWGVPPAAANACLCLRLEPRTTWWNAGGRTQLGLLVSEAPDLNLRVAIALHDLKLPATLGRAVLTYIAQSYIDRVRVFDTADWSGMVRAASQWPREDIEDAVAALTADGPLVADTTNQEARH